MNNCIFIIWCIILLVPLLIEGTLAKYEDSLENDLHNKDYKDLMESEPIHEHVFTDRNFK